MGKKKVAVRRKQCSVNPCRKMRVEGSLGCRDHQADFSGVDPMDSVKKLTELERLRYFEADNAMRNHAQEIRILDQEQRLEQVEFNNKKQTRQFRVDGLKAAIQQRTIEQRGMLRQYGEKYDFDPNFVSIDDTTGTIQEHTPGAD